MEQSERYNNFIRLTEINGIRLTGSEFFKSEDFDDYDFAELKKGITYQVETVETDDEAIYPHICWMLSMKKGNKIVLKIKACYELAYSSNEYFDNSIVEVFMSNAIKPATFPYFRQKVNAISNDASLEMPPLPILKLIPDNSLATEVEE
tara:strand:+ start:5884 stop:6330 length:447 start_codon:yes stop_codon:yes gene_type:complete